jgi:hypothetical protein
MTTPLPRRDQPKDPVGCLSGTKWLDYRLLRLSSVASQCAAISPFGFPEGLRPPIGKVNIYSTKKGQHFTDQSATMRIRAPEEDGAAGKG